MLLNKLTHQGRFLLPRVVRSSPEAAPGVLGDKYE
jgi:hypothetical protein